MFRPRILALLTAGGTSAVLGLALLGIDPFRRAFAAFDHEWWQIISDRNPYILLSRWTVFDWSALLAKALLLLTAAQLATAPQRRVIAAAALVGVLGVAATYLGSNVAGNVLVTNLQPWRSLWILVLIANAFAGALFCARELTPLSRIMMRVALVCAATSGILHVREPFSSVLLILACATALFELHRGPISTSFARVVLMFNAGLVAALWGLFLARSVPSAAAEAGILNYALAAVVGLSALALLLCSGLLQRKLTGPVAAGLLVLALLGVDRRSDWTRFVESPEVPSDLAAFVQGAGEIYWEDGLEVLWFKLRRPSYHSCEQGAGVMFYRATAEEYQRRDRGLSPLLPAGSDAAFCAARKPPSPSEPIAVETMRSVCRNLPDLNTLVLSRPVEGASAVWNWPDPAGRATDRERRTFYRIDC